MSHKSDASHRHTYARETIGRLNALRADGEEYDVIVGGLIDSCEAAGVAPLDGAETSDRSSGADETTRDEDDA